MTVSDSIVKYHDGGCVFTYDKDTTVLNVIGSADRARPSILKLLDQEWLPETMRAIICHNPDGTADLIAGVNVTIYLTVEPEKPKPAPRSFKELCKPSS